MNEYQTDAIHRTREALQEYRSKSHLLQNDQRVAPATEAEARNKKEQ